ncbi:MAG: phage portal protein [Desulfurellales bacterium]|nr:MAG: phage portal protein [Desulfurellales bacterium]
MAKLVKIPNNVNIRAHFGYEAASSGRRTAGWNPTSHGPNTLLSQSLDKLRDRSNDLTRQNPYAAAILDKWVSNAIGTGIDLRFRHPKRQVREVLKKRWTQAWSRVDFDQQTDMGGLQALAFRTMVVAGEGLGLAGCPLKKPVNEESRCSLSYSRLIIYRRS